MLGGRVVMHLQDVQILRNIRSSDGKSVSAVTETHFEFLYNGQWMATSLKSEIVLHVRPEAPEHNILKKLRAAAWADVRSYMNGDDVRGENIFGNSRDIPSQTNLSDEEEYELQELLRDAEREISTDHAAA